MSPRWELCGAWLAALCLWSESQARSAEPPLRALEIRIEAAGVRATVLERYLAVVAEDQPWRQPASEALQSPGEPDPSWRQPTGRYRAVCSALGFAAMFTEPFEVQTEAEGPREPHEIRCALQSLAYRTGRVIDAGGEPVAGARLIPLHLAMAESPLTLSPLGASHLRKNLEAVADEGGRFRVGGPLGSRASLWIEAAGFAPSLLPDVVFDDHAADLPPVRLERGGGLSVEAALLDGVDRNRYLIGLRPARGMKSANRAFSEAALHVWLKPLPGTGDFDGAWTSLPAGAYEVWLKERAPGSPARLPLILGRAQVATGTLPRLRVDIPGSQLARGEAASTPLRLLLDGAGISPAAGASAERWVGTESDVVPVVSEPVSGGLTLSIPSGCREGWLYTVRLGDRVSAAMAATGCGESARPVQLFPAADLRGRIRQPVGTPRPAQMAFTARRCAELPGGAEPKLGRFPIALERDGRWRAAVPAGCIHLRLEAAGFAPVAFASLGLASGGARDLGTVTLAPGGSILARVVEGDTGRAAAGLGAFLLSAAGLPEAVEALLAGRAPAAEAEARVDEQGWLRFDGVPPGSWAILIAGAEGRLLVSPLFAAAAGEELLQPDLELPAPATARLTLEAEVESLPERSRIELTASYLPAGCRWALVPRLRQALQIGEPLELSGLPPGRWRFEAVLLPPGGGRYTAGQVEADLAPDSFTVLDLPLRGRLFRGVVRFRGRPLAASVKLRSREAGTAPAQALSDRQGRFAVLLSKPGEYLASVWAEESALDVTVPRVRFDDPAEEVEVRLPEGAMSGMVVDREGRPVDRALVSAEGIESLSGSGHDHTSRLPFSSLARTDMSGRFEVVGLAAGQWELRATLGRNRPASRRVTVELGEDEVVPGLRLVIEEGRPLTVEARLGGRPAAGISGSALFLAADGGLLGQLAGFTTDLEGRHRFEAPPGEIAYVQLIFQPVAAPVAAFRLTFAEELAVELPALGGRVEIALPTRELLGVDPALLALVHDGLASIPLGYLRHAAQSVNPDGSSVIALPPVAPGRWRLVALESTADWQGLAAGREVGRVIETFDLAPGGEARIALPARTD